MDYPEDEWVAKTSEKNEPSRQQKFWCCSFRF